MEVVVDPQSVARVLTTLVTTRSLGPTQSERFVYLTTEDVASRPVNDTSTPPTVGCIN